MIDFGYYNVDCLEGMNLVDDKSVDMILTDLPYGTTQCKWDIIIPFEPLWEQYNRIIKDNGAVVLFSQMPFTASLVSSNLKDFKYMWIWNKHYCRGFLNAKKQPLRTTENICVFYKNQCTYNPEMRKGKLRQKGNSSKQRGCYGKYEPIKTVNDEYYPTDILDFVGVPNSELKHPTQKPVDLLEYLIKTYTNEGEIVLDSCGGSCSTGVACHNTGRKFIGFEKDEEIYKVGKERLDKEEAQMNLFDFIED